MSSWILLIVVVAVEVGMTAFALLQSSRAWRALQSDTDVAAELARATINNRAHTHDSHLILRLERQFHASGGAVPVEEVQRVVELTHGSTADVIRRLTMALPMVALLGTFLGIALALGETSGAQDALQQTLAAVHAQSAEGASSQGSGDFLQDAAVLRQELGSRMQRSVGGLQAYVVGQHAAMAGMAVAVLSTIFGISLALLLVIVSLLLDHRRRILVGLLVDLLYHFHFAQSGGGDDDGPTRRDLIAQCNRLVEDVRRVGEKMEGVQVDTQDTLAKTRDILDRVEPVAQETKKAIRGLNENVDRVNGVLESSVGTLQGASERLDKLCAETSGLSTVVQRSSEHLSTQANAVGSEMERFHDRASSWLDNWVEEIGEQSRSNTLLGRIDRLERRIDELGEQTESVFLVRRRSFVGRLMGRLL